jgi:membrane associated rhomboid family serine protease
MTYRTATSYRPFDAIIPPGVKLLIVANVAVFLLQIVVRGITPLLGLTPALVVHRLFVWQPLTYMFLHGGAFHLLFNMVILWMMGGEVERFWGRREFLRYYFLCGLGAAALAFVFAWNGLVIGASGAIFGVMVAFAVMFPNRPIYVWFVLPVPAKYLVLLLFALELIVVGSSSGVAHFAHVGGAVTGYLYLRLGLRDRLSFSLDGVRRRWYRRHLTLHQGGGRPAPDEAAEIDRILDKISRSGLASLTPEESRVLQRASRGYRER